MVLLRSVHGGSLHDLLVCRVRNLGSKCGLFLSIMGFTLLSLSLHLVGRRREVCRCFSFLLGQQAALVRTFSIWCMGQSHDEKNFPEHTAEKALKARNGIANGVLSMPASYHFPIFS